MTFGEFKAQFDIFNLIDNAEKLEHCKKQYKSYLLRLEDENYFEPEENSFENDIVGQYEKNLSNIFKLDNILESQFYFLVRPSFTPESLLIIDNIKGKFILKYIILEENYWLVFYENNTILDVKKIILTTGLDKTTGLKIFALLEKVMVEAIPKKGNGFTLDGTVFKISRKLNGEIQSVTKHSPSETSKPAKVISILSQLIDNIDTLEGNLLLDIENQIDKLRDE